MHSDVELMETVFLFQGLEKKELQAILQQEQVEIKNYAKEEVVFNKKTYMKALGILVDGQLEVSKTDAVAHKIIISTLNEGSVFGAATLFNKYDCYVNDIVAKGKSKVIFFSEELLREMMKKDFRIVENYLYYLSGRIRYMNHKIEGFTENSTEAKLLKFLRENASAQGVVDLQYSMKALSEVLNIGRASLYRAMDTLIAEGVINRDGKKIKMSKEK